MVLDDIVIAHIARLIQMAMLTGTDIVDHLRMMKLKKDKDDTTLSLEEEYSNIHNKSLEEMLQAAMNPNP